MMSVHNRRADFSSCDVEAVGRYRVVRNILNKMKPDAYSVGAVARVKAYQSRLELVCWLGFVEGNQHAKHGRC
jgi:hypothetical protein